MAKTTNGTLTAYAILCTRKDGSQFFATGEGCTPATWIHWKDAMKHAKVLREHLTSKVKVVKVDVSLAPVVGTRKGG